LPNRTILFQSSLWKWVLALAAGLYAFYLPAYFVGYFNDDALYLVGAKSLLQGRFVYLYRLHQPPINLILPGFPLILAPFVLTFGSHWAWYKFISVILTMGVALMTWKLFDGWIAPFPRIGLLALASWNPVAALYSGTVMSEPCYTFAVIGAFLLYKNLLNQPDRWIWKLSLGLCLAWASLIRPIGVVLLVAVAAGLAYEKRWRTLEQTFAIALPLWLAVMFRNYRLTHTVTAYFALRPSDLSASSPWVSWLGSFYKLADALFANLVLGWWGSGTGSWGHIAHTAIILLGGTLLLRGLIRFSNNSEIQEGMTLAMACFVFLHLWTHSFWSAFDCRYLLPVLPFVLAGCVAGLQGSPKKKIVGPVLFSLLIVLYACRHAMAFQEIWIHPSPVRQLPRQTLLWIQNLPGKEIIETARPATVYLYTAHLAETTPNLENTDLFHYWRLKTGISYIFYQDEPLLVAQRAVLWQGTMDWVRRHPKHYELIYQNISESTVVYHVLPDPVFLRQFESQLLRDRARLE